MVWLFSAAVPKGRSRKFHKPCSGPYVVVKQISDVTYCIQSVNSRCKRMVVHFDCLKPFQGDVQVGKPDCQSETIEKDIYKLVINHQPH